LAVAIGCGRYSFYPAIEGIFVDEVATDAATATTYYTPLYQYVKGKSASGVVIVNLGTIPDQKYMSAADVVVTFEDTYANYTNGSYPPNPAWISTYSRWRFWHLVLSAATVSDMKDAVSIARGRNVGYVHIADQDGGRRSHIPPWSGRSWRASMDRRFHAATPLESGSCYPSHMAFPPMPKSTTVAPAKMAMAWSFLATKVFRVSSFLARTAWRCRATAWRCCSSSLTRTKAGSRRRRSQRQR
jgi:hypothetical protein